MLTPKTPMTPARPTPPPADAATRTPAAPTPTRSARRGRPDTGSALILSLVTIVMLVMLGSAYLQVARTDRRTATAVDTRSNQNEGSILRYLGGILAGDLPQEIGGNPANFEEEFYDFPWSNDNIWEPEDQFAPTVVPGVASATAREPRTNAPLQDQAGRTTAEGGQLDDTWLASTEPEFPAGIWPHVTNVQGVFLDLNNISPLNDLALDPPSAAGRPMPAQYLSTADNNTFSGDTGAVPAVGTGLLPAGAEGRFADADGDGIVDARWTWAPLPSDGGLAYVMAVRVVDNSARLNINTASILSSNNNVNGKEPRWLWPGELDLEFPINDINAVAGFPNDLEATEVLGNMGRNLGDDEFLDRLDYWFTLTGQDLADFSPIGSATEVSSGNGETFTSPGTTYAPFGTRTEELELRWRNGLNRADDNVTDNPGTDLEGLAPNLFRDPNKHPSSGLAANDAEPTFEESGYNTVETFFLNEPRKQMTVASGSANFGQIDLNNVAADTIADVIEDAANNFAQLSDPANATTPRLYQSGGWQDAREFAAQAGAVLADFRDGDSLLSRVDNMYGMEYLPFISEVYLQGRYTAVVTPNPAALPDPSDDVVWTIADIDNTGAFPTTDSFAVAIELINPWPWEIEMPDIEVDIVDAGGNRIRWGTIDDLTGGKATMDANEVLILSREDPDTTDPVVNDEITAIRGLTVGPTGPVDHRTLPDAFVDAWPVGGGAAGVVLSALDENDGRVAYQLFTVDELPQNGTNRYTLGNGGTTGDFGYRQVSAFGTGNGLGALTVRDEDVDVDVHAFAEPNLLPPAPTETTFKRTAPQPILTGGAPLAEFAQALKGKDSPATMLPLDERLTANFGGSYDVGGTPDSGDEPWIIGNADRFYRTGDLLRAVVLGPRIVTIAGVTTTLTVADVWEQFSVNSGGVYSIRSAMFDLADPALVQDGIDAPRRMSHAAYLMGVFTNLESGVGLIPGRPNINTMPPRLLQTIFPFATSPATAVSDLIVAARNDPATVINRAPGTLGIQTVSQLAAPLSGPVIYDPTPVGNTRNEVVDFNEYEPNANAADATHLVDRHTDDVEEYTMAMTYLNQVASTRSDIYTAYVLVRGYPASDFGAGPSEEYRLVAVFDRSQVTGQGLPRILAVRRFADDMP